MRAIVIAPILLAGLLPLAASQDVPGPQSDPRNLAWAEEGVLAVGGGGLTSEDVAYLASRGFGAIADFRSEHPDPADAIKAAGMDYLYLPVDHAEDINITQLRTFLTWAQAEEAAGKPMYIHCANGWHRAATFAAAWEMRRNHWTMDEAFSFIMARRPGSELRAPTALLQFEAELFGKQPLLVALESDAPRPPPNGSMPVRALVWANGMPLANASVHFSTGSGRFDQRVTTGPDGVATVDFTSPPDGTFMDFLTARASAEGHGDGADTVAVYYGISVPAPVGLTARASTEQGGMRVDINQASGGPLHARIIATTSDGWSAWENTPTTSIRLPAPPLGGLVGVRVVSWGATSATASVTMPPTSDEAAQQWAVLVGSDAFLVRVGIIAVGVIVAAGVLMRIARKPSRRLDQ